MQVPSCQFAANMASHEKGEVIIHDEFDGSSLNAELKWWNEPSWGVKEGSLHVEPPSSSDLWQRYVSGSWCSLEAMELITDVRKGHITP